MFPAALTLPMPPPSIPAMRALSIPWGFTKRIMMKRTKAPRSWVLHDRSAPIQQGLLGWWWESQQLQGSELLSTWTTAPGHPVVHSGHSHGGQRGRGELKKRSWIRRGVRDREEAGGNRMACGQSQLWLPCASHQLAPSAQPLTLLAAHVLWLSFHLL